MMMMETIHGRMCLYMGLKPLSGGNALEEVFFSYGLTIA